METSRSIFVTNLPDFKKKKLKDKLEIHFGKRGNGGGDVEQIVITEQCSPIGTFAVITFAEKETVASVLKKQHIFFSKKLKVELLSSAEQEQHISDHYAPKESRLTKFTQLPFHDLKLIIHGPYAADVLQSTAEITKASLQVDEKSTKFCLKGPPVAIEQAVDYLGKHDTNTKTRPHELGDVGQRYNNANWITSVEKREHHTNELIADKKSLQIIPAKIVPNGTSTSPGSPMKDNSKLSRKKNEHLANTEKFPRNIAKFDLKILNYLHVVRHKEITEAGDRFQVYFEAKPDGKVEFKCRGQNTDQQSINESMKFLENLVNDTQKMGLVTEIVHLMQFKEAPKQKVDEAVKQTLKSTNVLVSLRGIGTLEFYGTEHGVHYEVEKLRAGILGRELHTDSQDDIGQTVYNQTNGDGTQSSHEELGNMAMVGHRERLASLDEDIAGGTSPQGVQFKKPLDAPSRKPLVHPIVTHEGSTALDDVQFSLAQNSIDGETYLSPNGPPTWKEERFPPLCSETNNEILYPPNQAKEENQASNMSNQSVHPVGLKRYSNNENLPDGQKKSSDLVSEEEVETAKPKVTYVHMTQETFSPQMQHSHLQGAAQDDDKEQASLSCQNDESSKMVEMSLDEVDSAVALFMAYGSAMSDMPGMETSPSCVPSEESSWGRTSPMKTGHISPVETSAAVSSPWDSSLVRWPPVDRSLGGASPVDLSLGGAPPLGISMGGMPVLNDTSSQSDKDFTVTFRTGMKVIIRHGDITDEFTDVIVTSADRHLHLKNGVGRAIREAAGEELVRACRRWTMKNGPVDYGKNVWTIGGNLKCSHVLHVVLRQSQGEMSHGSELKKTFMDLLKTCTHSLQASHVSMPAIGVEKMSVSNKLWARAFFEAVHEITQLYDKGWMQLSTLVLVDRNKTLIREVKRVFNDPILSRGFEESFQNVRQESVFPGSSNSFAGGGDFIVPRLRARGPSGVQKGASKKGFSKTRSLNRWGSYETSGKKDNSGLKTSFMDDLPVDPDHKCAICLGRINKEKKLRCKHSFCRQCVDTALKVHNYCPICKQPVQ